ncbi:PREDICTED: uncharacterized protein LOC105448373 [Wasmannia auropunctata]|uniref:uncharacterized protein LOC105448373 n=1 Tax=Wasmannia auropunctata TaxID=64793 RepID=UPI0005EEAEC4|nr:PREDICTED: uncharacterized protein LOC105448373 [Wasmannia auropunctata]
MYEESGLAETAFIGKHNTKWIRKEEPGSSKIGAKCYECNERAQSCPKKSQSSTQKAKESSKQKGLSANLLSITQMIDNSNEVIFNRDGCKIFNQNGEYVFRKTCGWYLSN